MTDERRTLSEDEILTAGFGDSRHADVMDADEDDSDTDSDDSDSDADTDDPS
jgi:hypothetical protein